LNWKNKKKTTLLIMTLILLFPLFCMARGANLRTIKTLNRNKLVSVTPRMITSGKSYKIIGRIRLVGSERFQKIVVTTDGELTVELDVSKANKEKILEYQNRYIEVEGVITSKKNRLADESGRGMSYKMKVKTYTILIVKDRDDL